MALLRPFTKDGVHYPEAYTRITSVRVDKLDAYVYATTHSTYQSRLDNEYPIFAEEHRADLASLTGPFFPACYTFLKTQPGFEQAVDFQPDEAAPEDSGVIEPEVVVEPEVIIEPAPVVGPPEPPLSPDTEIVVDPEVLS